MSLKAREREALIDAAEQPDGWALFKQKTTAKLAERGWFEKVQHRVYGEQFRITEAGLDALRADGWAPRPRRGSFRYVP